MSFQHWFFVDVDLPQHKRSIFRHAGLHDDEISAYSQALGLQSGRIDWWDRFDITTKEEYEEGCSMGDMIPDPEILLSLPDEKPWFTNYEEALHPLNALIYHLTDEEFLTQEREAKYDPEFDEQPEAGDFLHPGTLKDVVKDLADMRDLVAAARDAGCGFRIGIDVF